MLSTVVCRPGSCVLGNDVIAPLFSAQSQLYPDPHLAGMLATVCVALATAWQGAPLHKDR